MVRRRIAVVGAGGYVGSRLAPALAAGGHDVVAVVRQGSRHRADGMPTVEADRTRDAGAVDVVINVAHPRQGPSRTWPRQNRRLHDTLVALAGRSAHVIHVSTLAEFGDLLEQPVEPGPVAPRRALPYVACKLELLRSLRAALPDVALDVVRLGNIWGPSSPVWTAQLVERLRAGLPVGTRGHDGWSNATDVGNAIAYLAHLVEAPHAGGTRYHHLAELGALRWSHFTGLLAAHLHVVPALCDGPPRLPSPRLIDLVPGLRRLRSLATPRRQGEEFAGFDPLLHIMTCDRRFECHTLADWQPPIASELAWQRVADWLDGGPATATGSR